MIVEHVTNAGRYYRVSLKIELLLPVVERKKAQFFLSASTVCSAIPKQKQVRRSTHSFPSASTCAVKLALIRHDPRHSHTPILSTRFAVLCFDITCTHSAKRKRQVKTKAKVANLMRPVQLLSRSHIVQCSNRCSRIGTAFPYTNISSWVSTVITQ